MDIIKQWKNSKSAMQCTKEADWHFTATLQRLFWSLSLSLSHPDQVGDAGRILREWHSRGKREFCSVIIVMTHPFAIWHPGYSLTTCHTQASQFVSFFSFSLSFSPLFFSGSHMTPVLLNAICLPKHTDVQATFPPTGNLSHTCPVFLFSESWLRASRLQLPV